MKSGHPAFVLTVPNGRSYLVVGHGRHDLLMRLFLDYDAAPLGKGGRVADLIAWGSTFVCSECGPICPFCGREAELILTMAGPGWGHRRSGASA